MNALTYHRGVTHAGKSGETLVSGICLRLEESHGQLGQMHDDRGWNRGSVEHGLDHVALVRPHHRDRGGVGAIRLASVADLHVARLASLTVPKPGGAAKAATKRRCAARAAGRKLLLAGAAR